MEKKKKVTILAIAIIIIVALIITGIYFATKKVIEVNNEEKLAKIYDKMLQDETYKISIKLNDDNQYTIARKKDMAYIDSYIEGRHTNNIVKDGNTYLLMYGTKKYYVYKNNQLQLTEFTNELKEIIDSQENIKGKEKIDGKTYSYEEYSKTSNFIMSEENINGENVVTRFYFDGDDLKYIKTIINDKTELLQVDLSYEVDDNIFQIPSDFVEG